MTDTEFETVASAAINAANKVLYEAGITDRVVAQLGIAEASQIKTGREGVTITTIFSCPCWDCTGGPGPCTCNGPACHQQ